MTDLDLRHRQINNLCKKVTKVTRALIEETNALENTPEDEAAYHIMYLCSQLAEAKSKLFLLDSDDNELDLYEVCANAVRAAKEAL